MNETHIAISSFKMISLESVKLLESFHQIILQEDELLQSHVVVEITVNSLSMNSMMDSFYSMHHF